MGIRNSLGHWHFDSPFEHVALAAPVVIFPKNSTPTVAPFIN